MSELRRITERYRLDKLVGSSESGSVFRGADNRSGEPVAVKLINIEGAEATADEQRERFERLAGALQKLAHPGVPRVLDFGFTTAGTAFLVTEYLNGSTIASFAGSSPPRVISLLLLLVDGLEALAHEGLSTQNLRADNVLVVPGAGAGGEQVKILGLGTSAFRPSRGETEPGSDAYRSELHAFGVLACQLLGMTFTPDSEAPSVEIPPEVERDLEEPQALRALLEGALRLDPEGRLASHAEIRRALRLALFGDPLRTHAGERQAPFAETANTARLPRAGGWQEVRLGSAVPGAGLGEEHGEGTVVSAAASGPAAPPAADFDPEDTRAISVEETLQLRASLAAAAAAAGSQGTVRIERPAGLPGVSSTAGTVRMPLPAVERGGMVLLPFPGGEVAHPVSPPPLQAPPEVMPPVPPALEVPPPPEPTVPVLPVAATPPPLPFPSRPVEVLPPPPARPPNADRRLLLRVVLPLAALLLVGISLFALWMRVRSPAKPPPPAPQAVVQPAPPRPAPKPASTPVSVDPQIELAESSLGSGDLAGAKRALEAIPPETQALFSGEEQERYQRALAAIAPLEREALGVNLAQGLKTANLPLLRSAVGSVSGEAAAELPPTVQRDLARARKAVGIDAKLQRAQKAKNHTEIIRQASALLVELPGSKRTADQRERAAAAIEAEADSAAEAGQLAAAADRLEQLRQVWPDRAGLGDRLQRIQGERQADQELEGVLAAAVRAQKANKPLEGLQLLAGAKPNRRFADRFRQTREELEAQFGRLDQGAPELAVRPGFPFEYAKGETITVPLRVTDDQGVKSVEAWARPEGGAYAKVAVRRSGSDYAFDITPALHQNKPVDFYAAATDQSGHEGRLGGAENPRKIKRKKWYKKILGGKEEVGEEP